MHALGFLAQSLWDNESVNALTENMVYLSEKRYKYFSQHTELVCQCLVLFAVLWASFSLNKRIRHGGTVRNDSGAVRFLTVGIFPLPRV